MTPPPDDKTLDEYLQRDSDVSQQYRHLDASDVPPALDSAVLAQAREALTVTKAKRRPTWTRWSAPLALAASLVLGVAVLLEIGVDEKVGMPAAQVEQASESRAADATSEAAIEQVTDQPLASVTPAPAVFAPAAAPPPPAQRMKARDSVADADRPVALERYTTLSSEPPAEVVRSVAAPVADAALEEKVVVTGMAANEADKREAEQRQDVPSRRAEYSQARAQPAPAASAVRQTAAAQPVYSPPQAPRLEPVLWLERIRTLRRDGKVLEADEQWRQFSQAYPDFEVAANDLARPKP